MSSRKANKSRSRKRSAVPQSAWRSQTKHSATRTQTRVAPDELDIKLLYRTTAGIDSTSTPFQKRVFRPNAAYDVDPVLGSTETYGFDEYAALYSYYRVIGYSYTLTVVNRSDVSVVPIMAYVLNTNTDPTAAGTNYYLYSTNPHCQSKLISNVSPNVHTFRGRHTIAQIVGSKMVETSDSFRSLVTGIPSDLTFLTLGIEGIGTTSPAVAATFDLKLTMHVRFFARNVDLSLAALSARLNRSLQEREAYALQKKFNQEKLEKQKAISMWPDKPKV